MESILLKSKQSKIESNQIESIIELKIESKSNLIFYKLYNLQNSKTYIKSAKLYKI